MGKFTERFKKKDNPADAAEQSAEHAAPITRAELKRALAVLNRYKAGKSALEERIVRNERWWKLRQWEQITGVRNGTDRTEKPASGWLFNSVVQKHADAMDNYPSCNILPREKSDTEVARLLSQVLPVVIDRTEFRKTYSEGWWSKLKNGTAVYKVYWDPDTDGIGDIAIDTVDLLGLFWQPGIKDIQKSRSVFHVETWDTETLKETYGLGEDFRDNSSVSLREYIRDEGGDAQSGRSAVIDWWYKKRTASGKTAVHYCRFVGDTVLYASENDPEYAERGYYSHGQYPFVFDVLFPDVDMPTGFGYIDVLRDVQNEIDVINDLFSQRATKAAKMRYFINKSAGINRDDFTDDGKAVIEVEGSLASLNDMVREMNVPEPSPILLQYRNGLVDELKEVSGCRDVSQGGTLSGVTAASAIAALQEAGSKTVRDATQTSYSAYERICALVIELIRQFYKTERSFRITGEGAEPEFKAISGDMLLERRQSVTDGELFERRAVFDVAICAQKCSPFSRISQNELVKELYQLGAFRPDMADQALVMLEGMEFDGKEAILERVRGNARLHKQVEALTMLIKQITATLGSSDAAAQAVVSPQAGSGSGGSVSLGAGVTRGAAQAQAARARAQDAAAPVA